MYTRKAVPDRLPLKLIRNNLQEVEKMGKKSKHMTTFEFIEAEMFGIGLEYERYAQRFINYKTNPDFRDLEMDAGNHDIDTRIIDSSYTALSLSRRLTWLERIIDPLEEIYDDVNNTTQSIIGLLYKQGKSIEHTSEELDISSKRLIRQHTLIVDEVIEALGMSVGSKTKHKNSMRYIPTNVKTKVFERDEGKCTVCGSEEKIHYHHIQKFSDGGTHSIHNLILLCASCHANEHKGEREYNILKASI
jgi:hypothetical protein